MERSSKPRRVGVPKFLRYLYQILQWEDRMIIEWTEDGKAFHVYNVHAMACLILPKYFKHSKYASFQRQLNYFGFRKWTKTQTDICTFSHEEFRRGYEEGLLLIKRKNYPTKHVKARQEISEMKPEPVFDRLIPLHLSSLSISPRNYSKGHQPSAWHPTFVNPSHRLFQSDDLSSSTKKLVHNFLCPDPAFEFHQLEMDLNSQNTPYQEYWMEGNLDNLDPVDMKLESYHPNNYIEWEPHNMSYNGHQETVSSF